MTNTAMNDMSYSFEPLVLFEPDPNYKIDEAELQKSIEKNRELIKKTREKLVLIEK